MKLMFTLFTIKCYGLNGLQITCMLYILTNSEPIKDRVMR